MADNKMNGTEKLKFVLGRVENIVVKGENAVFSHFPAMFSKGFFLGDLLNSCVVKS